MSPTAWNLEDLRSRVRRDQSNSDYVLKLIDSINRSDQIFQYHMATAREAMKGLVNETEPQGAQNFMLVLGVSKKQSEFAYAKIVSEANIIGCLYTARNLWDVFAQLVNALALAKPRAVGTCDIKGVVNDMPASPLKSRLKDLLKSHWYIYVAAFINTTKHRQLVQHMMTVSVVENRAGIQIGGFTYAGKSFKTYWGQEVLEGAIEVKNTIIECGRLLNDSFVTPFARSCDPGSTPLAART